MSSPFRVARPWNDRDDDVLASHIDCWTVDDAIEELGFPRKTILHKLHRLIDAGRVHPMYCESDDCEEHAADRAYQRRHYPGVAPKP